MLINNFYKENNFMKNLSILLIMALIFPLLNTKVNADSYEVAYSGKEVLVFLAGAIIGGLVYDGVKWTIGWGLSTLTPFGIATLLSLVTVAGGITVAAYMRSKDRVDYVEGSNGCRMAPNGNSWVCPYRSKQIV